MKLANRLVFIIISVTAVSCMSVMSFFVYQIYVQNKEQVANTERILKENYDKIIRTQVENAISMLAQINKMKEQGIFTEEQAKKYGADILRELRYDKDGYFWADTEDGVNVVLYGSPTEGTNRINFQDVKGTYIIQKIIAAAKQPGGGYTDYWFPKKGETVAKQKRGYSLFFEPFKWSVGTGNYIDDIELKVKSESEALQKALVRHIISVVIFTILLIGAFSTIAFYLGKRVATPILKLKDCITLISEFNIKDAIFEQSEVQRYKSEIKGMAFAVIKMRDNLAQLLENIRAVSDELVSASEELSAATTISAENAGRQAMSSEQITAVIEEISGGMDRIADGAVMQNKMLEGLVTIFEELSASINKIYAMAEETAALSEKIAKDAEVGESLMRTMNQNMINVSKSSEDMKGVVNIISDISEQINLLSLNASIEAARGFAVVAEEISKLAERTSISIKEIEKLINLNYAEIKSGLEAVGQTSLAAGKILTGVSSIDAKIVEIKKEIAIQQDVNKTADTKITLIRQMSEEILHSTSEHKLAVEEITNQINDVNNASQQIAENSTEIAGSSENLAAHAEKLSSMISVFKF
ncbi:MAG: cache domain-containing protein [Spirochaetes bacterium]|nr:cache domain-containing protein [Spirochaetota bacterium]